MRIFKFILNIASWLMIGLIAVMALYMISSNFNILSGYRSFLVQSGSMEPAIMTGDIIIIHPKNDYSKNDVITFYGDEKRIVTHRIIDFISPQIITKGDANRTQDSDYITKDNVMGSVVFIIPKLGYLVAFSKTIPGLILLVMVPASLFIVDELIKVKNA